MLTMESRSQKRKAIQQPYERKFSWARLCGQKSPNRIFAKKKNMQAACWRALLFEHGVLDLSRLIKGLLGFQYTLFCVRLLQRKLFVCMYVCADFRGGTLNKELRWKYYIGILI